MTNPQGRPMKNEGPRFDRDAVDRLLVHGEPVPTEDGKAMTIRYPGIREIARRYDVNQSVISEYSKHHNCVRRRREAELRTHARVDEKTIEMRANTLAVTKAEQVQIIDNFIRQFEQALQQQRVRADNPSDFNCLVRLKEYIEGGPDSRQEVNSTVSLEALQVRHREAIRTAAMDGDSAVTGLQPPAPRTQFPVAKPNTSDNSGADTQHLLDGPEPSLLDDPEPSLVDGPEPSTATADDEPADDQAPHTEPTDEGGDATAEGDRYGDGHTASADGGTGALPAPPDETGGVLPEHWPSQIPAVSPVTWPHLLEGAELELEGLPLESSRALRSEGDERE